MKRTVKPPASTEPQPDIKPYTRVMVRNHHEALTLCVVAYWPRTNGEKPRPRQWSVLMDGQRVITEDAADLVALPDNGANLLEPKKHHCIGDNPRRSRE